MQYSDDAKTEFRLNAYNDKGTVLSALKLIRYRGGNTKTGITTTRLNIYSCSKYTTLKVVDTKDNLFINTFRITNFVVIYDPNIS